MRMQELYYDVAVREQMIRSLLLERRRSPTLKFAFRRADGSPIVVLARIRLLDARLGGIGGNVIGSVVVDITERKRQESALQERARGALRRSCSPCPAERF